MEIEINRKLFHRRHYYFFVEVLREMKKAGENIDPFVEYFAQAFQIDNSGFLPMKFKGEINRD